MAIKFVKLITGEELLADVSIIGDAWSFKNPSSMMPTPKGIQPIPYPLIPLEEDIVIKNKDIVFMATPGIDAVNFYNAKFGSGLVVPSNSLEI